MYVPFTYKHLSSFRQFVTRKYHRRKALHIDWLQGVQAHALFMSVDTFLRTQRRAQKDIKSTPSRPLAVRHKAAQVQLLHEARGSHSTLPWKAALLGLREKLKHLLMNICLSLLFVTLYGFRCLSILGLRVQHGRLPLIKNIANQQILDSAERWAQMVSLFLLHNAQVSNFQQVERGHWKSPPAGVCTGKILLSSVH